MPGFSGCPALILTFTSWLLILLVTASTPISKSIDIVNITTTDGGFTVARAGVFGLCYPGGHYYFSGSVMSTVAHCTEQRLGYKLDTALLGGSAKNISNALSEDLSPALVMNAISCAFAALGLCFSFLACACTSIPMEAGTIISLWFAGLIGWGAFTVDLAMPLVARHRIHRSGMGNIFVAQIGNGVWICLAAMILYTIASCAAFCGSLRMVQSVSCIQE